MYCDVNRFVEAKEELQKILMTENINNTPILVLGNKIDCKNSVSEYDFRNRLALHMTTGKNNNTDDVRPIEVFMCSIIRRVGYTDGFKWLSKFI